MVRPDAATDRNFRERRRIQVLQSVVIVRIYRVAADVIGPARFPGSALQDQQRLARRRSEDTRDLPSSQHMPNNGCRGCKSRQVIDNVGSEKVRDVAVGWTTLRLKLKKSCTLNIGDALIVAADIAVLGR